MKTIIISPYSRKLRNGDKNPKDYPYWNELVQELKKKDFHIIQIGVEGEEFIQGVDEIKFNQPLKEIEELLKNCHAFISVDNFLPHMANCIGVRGVVLFSRSDPALFGYKENINLLKDSKYLRINQFDIWERCDYIEDAFIEPEMVVKAMLSFS
jgi:ADP-heptose:LPS heptosyltransferase